LLFGCKKKNNTLSGNYFTATINGSSFLAGGHQSFVVYTSAQLADTSHFLLLSGGDDNQNINITLYDSNGITNKIYYLNNPPTVAYSSSAEYRNYGKDISHGYVTDAYHTGVINIQLDTLKHRISGSFSFKGIFQSSTDSINVTNGKFSLPYINQ